MRDQEYQVEKNPERRASIDALGRHIAAATDPDRRRIRELELALRECRRFANEVAMQWETLNGAARQEALRVQDLTDTALGYCGCPDCSEVRDRADGTYGA